jgi:type I restriction enzyme R subunit
VAFFQAVQAVLAKRAPGDARPEEEIEHAVRNIISRAVAPEGVIDIFAAAGLARPDISILSDDFLAEVRGMPQRNLAVELLQKLLKGELATRRRRNLVQARSFAEMLEQTIRRYQNRAIEAAQVIEELIALARDMREAQARGEALRLSDDELAFYDALEVNDSAVKVLGDDTLRDIARELVKTVRRSVTIDWTLRENVRAQLRVIVKRILRKYGYPPDKQEKATQPCWSRPNCSPRSGRPLHAQPEEGGHFGIGQCPVVLAGGFDARVPDQRFQPVIGRFGIDAAGHLHRTEQPGRPAWPRGRWFQSR